MALYGCFMDVVKIVEVSGIKAVFDDATKAENFRIVLNTLFPDLGDIDVNICNKEGKLDW